MQANEFYGGQAVIEGVMMRGTDRIATAVRRDDGEIVVDRKKLATWGSRYPFLRWPFVRGSVALVESLLIGMQSLSFSANVFAEDEDVKLSTRDMVGAILLAVAMTVVFFIALPAGIIMWLQKSIPVTFVLNLVEGLIKVSFFIVYLVAISFLPDIRRVFEYHGAEHKVINAFEHGEELKVEAIRPYSVVHTRCGTNFLFIVLLVSVFVFSFFGRPPFIWRVLIHLAILPVVAGLSYEIIRSAARPKAFFLVRWLARPGMWMQALTTREPDDRQIEVAIRALSEVLPTESATVVPFPGPRVNGGCHATGATSTADAAGTADEDGEK